MSFTPNVTFASSSKKRLKGTPEEMHNETNSMFTSIWLSWRSSWLFWEFAFLPSSSDSFKSLSESEIKRKLLQLDAHNIDIDEDAM